MVGALPSFATQPPLTRRAARLQHFLANSNVSRFFAEILLSFLVSRMHEFGTADAQQVV